MRKTMICINAPTNTGKTSTIKKVHELLGGKEEVRNQEGDFVDVLMYENTVIGCESEGDPPGAAQWQALEYLMGKKKCDIVIGASRTRDKTINNVKTLLKKYNYDVIWVTPAYVYDPLDGNKNAVYDFIAQKNAEIIIELIHQLISNKICGKDITHTLKQL